MTKTLALALFLGLAVASAQQPAAVSANPTPSTTTITAVPEPEWTGQVLLLVDGKLLPLETQKFQHSVKIRAYRGGEAAYVVPGTSSSTKVVPNPEFVVKLEVTGDPASAVNIDRMEVDGKAGVRKIVTVARRGLLGGKNSASSTNVELKFERYGASSLRFTPKSPLTPGEYAATTNNQVAYLFRVE